MANLSHVVVRKARVDGSLYGDEIKGSDLKGKVGLALAREIENSALDNGAVEVYGYKYKWWVRHDATPKTLEA